MLRKCLQGLKNRRAKGLATAFLIIWSAAALAQTIQPGDSNSLSALGHTWTFGKIQDDYTGFNVLKDGKATSLHGISLEWDGTKLILTDHHPNPFDPNTGQSWTPPQRTYTLTGNEATNPP